MERNARLLTLRGAALLIWLACVLAIVLPRHSGHAARFDGGKLPAPKLVPARGE